MNTLSILLSVATFVLGILLSRFNQLRTDEGLYTELRTAAGDRKRTLALLNRVALLLEPNLKVGKEYPDYKEHYFEEVLRASLEARDFERAELALNDWATECPHSHRRQLGLAEFSNQCPLQVKLDESREEAWKRSDERTEGAYKRARELAPDSDRAAYAYGFWRLHHLRKADEITLQQFGEAVVLAPENEAALYLLAYCQWLNGDHTPALSNLQKLVAINPRHDKARDLKAMALRKLGRNTEAAVEASSARILNGKWRLKWLKRSILSSFVLFALAFFVGAQFMQPLLGESLQNLTSTILILALFYSLGMMMWSIPADNSLEVSPQLRDMLDVPELQSPIRFGKVLSAFDAIMPRPTWTEDPKAVADLSHIESSVTS